MELFLNQVNANFEMANIIVKQIHQLIFLLFVKDTIAQLNSHFALESNIHWEKNHADLHRSSLITQNKYIQCPLPTHFNYP